MKKKVNQYLILAVLVIAIIGLAIQEPVITGFAVLKSKFVSHSTLLNSKCKNDYMCAGFLQCNNETMRCHIPRLECRQDTDCRYNEQCQEFKCVKKPNPWEVRCSIDADCPDGYDCIKRECVFQNDCRTSADCPDWYICSFRQCTKKAENTCIVDSDCPSNTICDDTFKKCVMPCVVDADCPSGSHCSRFDHCRIGNEDAGKLFFDTDIDDEDDE